MFSKNNIRLRDTGIFHEEPISGSSFNIKKSKYQGSNKNINIREKKIVIEINEYNLMKELMKIKVTKNKPILK